jgi:hypothetical protein
MKRKFIMAALALIVIGPCNSFAVRHNPLKTFSIEKVISTYVESATMGITELDQYLFTDDFEYYDANNNRSFDKTHYTRFLKANKGLKYKCKTSYEKLDESGKACIAKLVMQYDTFTRVDHISLAYSQDGWKVRKIVTSYF